MLSKFQGFGLIQGSAASWDEREALVGGVNGSGENGVKVGSGLGVWVA